ncbi:MAG: Transcription elongation factor GreA [candidate division WS6 bacterium 34_10]|jgi:transcription elongation factor GreA|uniref:Transcription elongation factor GreA n=1 Tax=candidate division WS6 bacterium 34_10 TaxID=1641389 RepID=A0A101HG36_9BACT|nr:MAG: Transcription elongation factor GreA [candidate division WS6 bacterium 34_10]
MGINEVYETTKKGLEKLVEEVRYRENELRKKIATQLSEMRSQGDLRENDGYSMAVEEQHINEEKIAELREKIRKAKVVKDQDKNKVGLGDTVTLRNSKVITYEITSEDDANPLEGKISHKSPIGMAIMGKKVGETIEIKTPKGVTEYTIEKIA